jgi:hypothetical protein
MFPKLQHVTFRGLQKPAGASSVGGQQVGAVSGQAPPPALAGQQLASGPAHVPAGSSRLGGQHD